jgi:putative hydroxymethylpyrimidine transport system permease protein
VPILLLIWQYGLPLTNIPNYILPLPSEILYALWDARDLWMNHVIATWSEALIGLLIAALLSFMLAIPMHWFVSVRKTMYPLLVISQTIPILAISPLFIIWFDYSIWSKVAVVVLWTFFPLIINLNDGLRNVPHERLEILKSLGANRWQQFRYVEFPHVIPLFFSGLQLAAVYSIAGATVGEWLGASEGLGFFARRASNNLQVDLLFAAVLLLCLMGMVMFFVVKWTSNRFLFWQNKN